MLDVLTADGGVTGVRTDAGDIEAEIVVNCAGQWAKAIGALAGGVNVPLHSAEHFYVVTETIAGVHPDLPILRDPDGYTYFKEEVGGLVIGGFEPEAKPWVAPRQDSLPPLRVSAARRGLGALRDPDGQCAVADSRTRTHRPEEAVQRPGEFHPPGQPIHPRRGSRVRQFLRRRGIQLGGHRLGRRCRARTGGVDRQRLPPTTDLTGVDIRRFAPFNGNVSWLHDRVAEILGVHYEIPPWPNRELATARPFRRSPPVHHLLVAAGGQLR